ncbi:hypothetical protein Hs30E_04320 [Lactococcus hodotermopsidis]|uniref:Uncharacterized protein n=1 Tax=Pseudolactococcus hodotermopsidis TaxID=2709157 RepID=A0A6A0BBN6_9LACT|nr:oligosaccharide flippase family protein [Lactococcus hodotermopsidis]GFH41881.1 hypothetical protein Hs30E_04320 [Lactococcus hodotermopsidis]
MLKYKNILLDMFSNLVANGISVAVIQVLIFPFIASKVDSSVFGMIVAVYGINTTLTLVAGNSIGMMRVKHQSINGENFNLIAFTASISIVIVAMPLFFMYGEKLKLIDILVYLLTTGLQSMRLYLNNIFRVKFDLKKYNIVTMLNSFGQLFGFLLFLFSKKWSYIFLFGEIFSLCYIFLNYNKKGENYSINEKFKEVFSEVFNFSLSTLFIQFVANMDKFIIIPILGAKILGQYFGLSTVGKIILFVTVPVSNVLFSYIAKSSKEFNKKSAAIMNGAAIIGSLILTFPFSIVSKFICSFLYPEYVSSSNSFVLINIITFGTLLSVTWNLVNLYYIKHLSMKYQRNSQFLFCSLSILLAIIFSNKYGVIGYALSQVIVGFCKFFIQILILFFLKKHLKNINGGISINESSSIRTNKNE